MLFSITITQYSYEGWENSRFLVIYYYLKLAMRSKNLSVFVSGRTKADGFLLGGQRIRDSEGAEINIEIKRRAYTKLHPNIERDIVYRNKEKQPSSALFFLRPTSYILRPTVFYASRLVKRRALNISTPTPMKNNAAI